MRLNNCPNDKPATSRGTLNRGPAFRKMYIIKREWQGKTTFQKFNHRNGQVEYTGSMDLASRYSLDNAQASVQHSMEKRYYLCSDYVQICQIFQEDLLARETDGAVLRQGIPGVFTVVSAD